MQRDRAPFLIAALVALAVGSGASCDDFASRVIAYAPAPGQFINNPQFNDPSRALGPPVGGGTDAADNTKLVSLGGFGGSIILAFDSTVWDDPRNPMGLDAIVFGNAVWVGGDPNTRFAEAGVIEISRDANGNGLADDAWFVVPGSSIPRAPNGAPAEVHRAQAWDHSSATPTPPANTAWYPQPAHYPGHPSSYSTSTFELPAPFGADRIVNPNGAGATAEGHFGYADLTPTLRLGDMSGAPAPPGSAPNSTTDPEDLPGVDPAEFYTVPDDPFTVGVSPGSAGGDAFDIAWAVDALTGEAADLDGFDFIRISTGVHAIFGPGGILGEVSTEIGAVARVRPLAGPASDLNGDGAVTAADLAILLGAWGPCAPAPGTCPADLDESGDVDAADLARLLGDWGAP